MALTTQERTWLKESAENSARNGQLLETHSRQIADIFEQQSMHADKITVIGTRQSECAARKRQEAGMIGTASDKVSNSIAVGAMLIAVIAVIVGALT